MISQQAGQIGDPCTQGPPLPGVQGDAGLGAVCCVGHGS